MPPSPPPPAEPTRILLIRPSALGDVCRTVPVLASLRRTWPAARIDWLIQDTFADAVRAHPALSGLVVFPRRRFARWWSPPVTREVVGWLRSLARGTYDLVLDCQGLARSAIFARATGAPRRLGYADAPELAWLGLTERVDAPRTMHTVDRMLSLARAAGATPVHDLRLYAPESDRAAVAADPDLSSDPFAVLAPTSRWSGKRWPIERFVRLAERMLRDPRLAAGAERLVIVGGPQERNQCGPLLDLAAREPRLVDRIGTTSVGGLLALVERSRLVVANDSAVLHIAVGFDRPMVALFGPTRVDRVGPYGRSADVVQRVTPADRLDHKDAESGRRLMERITLDDVLERLHRLASSVNADTARRAAAG